MERNILNEIDEKIVIKYFPYLLNHILNITKNLISTTTVDFNADEYFSENCYK